jgi:hypothetical protein
LLWKVSDDDNTVYLLGSFHLLKADDYPLSADIESAFEDAERLVFEVPAGELTDPANASKFMAAAGYADGNNLSGVLSSEVREKLEAMLSRSGLPIAAFEQFEPWFINLSLLMGAAQPMGFSSAHGLDQHFMLRAQESGKPSVGLETLDQQLQVLDGVPMKEQVASLKEFVDSPADVAAQLNDLHAAWRSGDVARLDALVVEEMKDKTPESYRMMNVERNDAWLPQIRAMLDEPGTDDVLVVVGALHLLGEDGVVEKLGGGDYAIERICSACATAAD